MAKTFKKIILDDIKAQGWGHLIKKITSIRYKSYSMGCSVDVDCLDCSKHEREFLKTLLDRYQYGHFDGMTDCYEYSNKRTDVERQAKYVFLNVNYSDEMRDKAKQFLKDRYDVTDDKSSMAKLNEWYDTMVWRTLQEYEK